MSLRCLLLFLLPLFGWSCWAASLPTILPPFGFPLHLEDPVAMETGSKVDLQMAPSAESEDEGAGEDEVPPYGWSVLLDDPVEIIHDDDTHRGHGGRLGSPGRGDDSIVSGVRLDTELQAESALNAERNEKKRIVYGKMAEYGDHPYICSLQLRQWGVWFHICGSVIYNSKTVITAAHCVKYYGAERLRVVCGEHNLKLQDHSQVSCAIDAILLHPDYSESSRQGFPNDLAMLKLQTALDLAASPYLKAYPIDDGKTDLPPHCVISGWGRTEVGSLPSVLRDVEIPRQTNAECNSRWRGLINDGHVCFGEPGDLAASCNGDSGGPARCGDVIVGVTSWGIRGCVSSVYPSVYTRLSHYHDWIVNNCF